MSKSSEHYERILLGVGLVVFLLAGWFSYTGWKKAQAFFDYQSTPPKDLPEIASEPQIDHVTHLFGEPPVWKEVVDSKNGVLDLFTGAKRFVTRGAEGKLIKLQEGVEVHTGIPNMWWFEHGIGADIGWKDALERDPDGDGFTNKEEFDQKTHPNEITNHPPLSQKLHLVQVEKYVFELSVSGVTDESARFRFRDNRQQRRTVSSQFVKIGEPFYEGRFILKELKTEEVENSRTQSKSNVQVAYVQKRFGPNQETLLRIPYRAKPNPVFTDLTAVLKLQAIGEFDKTFKVSDTHRFALPFQEKAEEKPYQLSFKENGQKVEISTPEQTKVELKAPTSK